MATLTTDPCAVLDALAQFQFGVIRALNRKFNQLQRLAELLEQLGDVSELVPNIAALVPVGQIDLDVYIRLQQNCPFLGLPPASAGTLDSLRTQVFAAYDRLIGKLLNHPWSRMNLVQGYLARFQNEINADAAVVTDYLTCLQTVCDTLSRAGTAFAKITSSDISREVGSYTKNFVQNGGQVLSAGAKSKASEINTTVDLLKQLKTV